MSPTRRKLAVVIAIALTTFALDQGSKAWAHGLPVAPIATAQVSAPCTVPGDLIALRCGGIRQPVIVGLWDWELAMNPGAAFSTWAGTTGSRIVLSLIAALAVIGVGVAVWRSRSEQRLRRVALAVIVGGVLGNLIDRVRFGAVTDFVSWHVHNHYWPVFNVADVALLGGAALLLVDSLRKSGTGPAPALA